MDDKDYALIKCSALLGYIEGMPERPTAAHIRRLKEYANATGLQITKVYSKAMVANPQQEAKND
jgi:hypothetical protein